jgi:hypothetical protein
VERPSPLPNAVVESAARALVGAHGLAVPIDALGPALGADGANAAVVEALVAALEALGASVQSASTRAGGELLQVVLAAAAAFRKTENRAPTRAEIAALTGLADTDIAHALEFSKVLARTR